MTEDKFCFLDTNILIYASDSHSPWHKPAKEKIKKLLSEGFRLFISPQILREYVSVASRSTGTDKPAPWDMILENYESFQKHFTLLGEDHDTVNELSQLLSKIPAVGKQVHDTNICGHHARSQHPLSAYKQHRGFFSLFTTDYRDSPIKKPQC